MAATSSRTAAATEASNKADGSRRSALRRRLKCAVLSLYAMKYNEAGYGRLNWAV